jgi:periplasmic protein CpxP/Spy
MKSIKMILAVIAISLTTTFYAQQTPSTPEERANKQTEHLSTELSLSADQKQQIQAINLGIIQKNDAIRANDTMSQELKTESIKQNNEARKTAIKAILTLEQNEKFDSMEKTQMQRKKQLNRTLEKPVQNN